MSPVAILLIAPATKQTPWSSALQEGGFYVASFMPINNIINNQDDLINNSDGDLLFFDISSFDALTDKERKPYLAAILNIARELMECKSSKRIAIYLPSELPTDINDFARELPVYNVYDFFQPHNGKIEIDDIIKQLKAPRDIKNCQFVGNYDNTDDDQENDLDDEPPENDEHNFDEEDSNTISSFLKNVLENDYSSLVDDINQQRQEDDHSEPENHSNDVNQETTPIADNDGDLDDEDNDDQDYVPADELNQPSTDSSSVINSDETNNDANDEEKETTKTREQRNSKPKNQKKKKHSHRKVIIGSIAAIALLSLGAGFAGTNYKQTSAKQVSSTPSLTTLINKQEFTRAAKTYPQQVNKIDDAIINNENIKGNAKKNEIDEVYQNTSNITPTVTFDHAFFNHNFKNVIATSNKIKNLSKTRKVMLSFSYLATGNVNQAQQIANEVGSSSLNERIQLYQQLKDENQKLNDKLNQGNLSDTDKSNVQNAINQNNSLMKQLTQQ